MNRLITRTGLLLVIAFAMNACSSKTPKVTHDTATAHRVMAQPQPAPRQYLHEPANYSGLQERRYSNQHYHGPAYRYGTQAPTTSRYSKYRLAKHHGPFQKPPELEPAVEFWRKTYTVWNRSEVVFHDNRFMDVIYEVMVLPGYVDEALTNEQKERVSQRRDFWKAQLYALDYKLRYNAPLNANDRQLIAKLQTSGSQLNTVLNGAAERVRSQRGTRERFMRGMEISRRYDQRFRKIFREHGLPEDLAYLPHVESSFQPTAKSSAGAVGMWQFTQAAARTFIPGSHRVKQTSSNRHRYKKSRSGSHKKRRSHRSISRPRADPRLDPFASAVGAARYLSQAYSRLGDWPTAITSYNHGIGGMKRAQDQVGRDFAQIVELYSGPAFGFASRNYYAQFLAVLEIANNPRHSVPANRLLTPTFSSGQHLTAD